MNDKQPSRFGVQLKLFRESANLSQQDLAQKARCTVGVISRLERGMNEPSWPIVLQLAEALGVSVSAFVVDKKRRDS